MSGERSYFRLGLFVLGGLALVIAGVVVLGAGAMFTETVPFETVTTESVEGLSPGAPVKFRGVAIGKVAKVEVALIRMQGADMGQRIAAGNEILISMDLDQDRFQSKDLNVIRENFKTAADAGMRARITSSGIAGPPYVEFLFLDPVAYPAPKVVHVSQVPYIPSAPGTLSKIAEDVGAITAQLRTAGLDKVVANVDKLITTANGAVADLDVAGLRSEMGDIAVNVKSATQRLDGLLANKDIEMALADLPAITRSLKSTLDRVDAIAKSPSLNETVDNLSKVSGSANLATAELRRTLRLLNQSIASQQETLGSIVSNLRTLTENANTLTEDVKRNPSRVLFGKSPTQTHPGGSK